MAEDANAAAGLLGLPHRLAPDELDALASAAGLSLVERWSDWRRTPFTADDNTHVSIYEVTR